MGADATLKMILLGEDRTASKAIRNVAGALGAIGIGAFIKDSVNLEANFSSTMAQVKASTDAPAAAMQKLSDLAIQLGNDTIFSANDAANAMLELAKSGLQPATIQAGALKATMTLAAAGGLELADAGHAVGNALNMFNLKGKQAGEVAAALAGAANASSADVSDLTLGLAQVGPGAAAAGLSIQEVTGVLAAFNNAGMKGSDAGTSLKQMLASLVPKSSTAAAAMESLGLFTNDLAKAQQFLADNGVKVDATQKKINAGFAELAHTTAGAGASTEQISAAYADLIAKAGASTNAFFKSNGEMKSAAQISQILQDATKHLSDEERIKALNQIFGSDASRAAALAAHEGAKGMRTYIAAAKDQAAADKMAAARMSGTKGALERLKGSVETAQLKIGQALAPAVQNLANLLANDLVPATSAVIAVVSAVVNLMHDHATITGILAGLIAGLIVVTKLHAAVLLITSKGGMLAYLKTTKLVTGATKMWAAVQWLLNAALSANPIALVVIGIAALVAAIVVAWKKSDTFRRIVTGAFHAVLDAAKAAWNWVKQNWPLLLAILTGPIGIAVLVIAKHWDSIKEGASSVFDFIKGIPAKIGGLAHLFGDAGKALIGALFDGLLHAGGAIADFSRAIVNNIIDFLNKILPHHIGIHKGPFNLDVPLFPEIPHLAAGGIVTRPTLALIGESGPEAVVPLGRGGRMGGDVHITINGALDPIAVGKQVQQALLKVKRANGGAALGLS